MDLFEFVAGMISVILALAAAQLFLGLAGVVQARSRVIPSLHQAVWLGNLFLITFLHWWSLWDFRGLAWNFPMFLYSLVGPALMFFAATLINPRDVARDPIDLAEHFAEIRRPFLAVVLAMMVVMTLDGPLFGTEGPFNRLRLSQLLVIGLTGWGLVTASRVAQSAISVMVLAAISIAVFARFFPGVIV